MGGSGLFLKLILLTFPKTSGLALRIFQHSIPVSLRIAVHSIWMVEDEVTRKETQKVRAFPHGFVYISVNAEKKFKIRHGQLENYSETKSYLCGQITRPSILEIPNVHRSLVIRFHPWVAPALFGISAAELADQYIPLQNIDPDFSYQLEDLIEGDIPFETIASKLEKIIQGKFIPDEIDQRLLDLSKHVIRKKGAIDIQSLSDEASISNRRLQQLFTDYIGISAKKFSRIVRMQYYMFDVMTNGEKFNLYDYYFDQSHFSREVKALSGLTPLQLEDHLSNFYARQAYLQTNLYYP